MWLSRSTDGRCGEKLLQIACAHIAMAASKSTARSCGRVGRSTRAVSTCFAVADVKTATILSVGRNPNRYGTDAATCLGPRRTMSTGSKGCVLMNQPWSHRRPPRSGPASICGCRVTVRRLWTKVAKRPRTRREQAERAQLPSVRQRASERRLR